MYVFVFALTCPHGQFNDYCVGTVYEDLGPPEVSFIERDRVFKKLRRYRKEALQKRGERVRSAPSGAASERVTSLHRVPESASLSSDTLLIGASGL